MDLSRYATMYSPEDEEATTDAPSSTGMDLSQYYGTTQPQETAPSEPKWMQNRAVKIGMGAARGLDHLTEFLHLPQDIVFAIAAGNASPDDNVTVADRLKDIEWAKYAPLGAAPARPADGKEILELLGEKDPAVTKWGGLIMDLVADPLLAGSAIRGVGKLGKVERLVQLGDQIEEATSIGGIARIAYRNSPAVKAWTDSRTETLLRAMRSDSPLGNTLRKTAGATLTTRVQRNLKYGREFGEGLSDARALADQAGSDVRGRAFDLLADVDSGLMGKDTRPWFQKGLGILSGRKGAESGLKGLPQILHDAISKEGYDLAQKRGLLTTEGLANSAIPEVQRLSPLQRFVPEARRTQALSDTESAVARIRQAASDSKFDPDVAEGRFRTFSQKVTEIDAMLGYHVTGLDWVQKKVMENVRKVGGTEGDAATAWDRLVSAGMGGNMDGFLDSSTSIRASGVGAGEAAANASRRNTYSDTLAEQLNRGTAPAEARRIAAEARDAIPVERSAANPAVSALYERRLSTLSPAAVRGSEDVFKATRQDSLAFGRNTTPLSYREVLFQDAEDKFSSLDLGAYFRGLQEGHMRRTYAAFQDKKGAEQWVRSLEQGRVVMSNILSDDMIDTAFTGIRGATDDASTLLRNYRSTLESGGRGTILSQKGITQHLTENGVSPKDANGAYMKLVEQMNPELKPVMQQIRDYADSYAAKAGGGQTGGMGKTFYGPREELDVPFLESLGEYANPLFSLAESANAAKTRVTRGQFMREVYDLAVEKGLVKEGADKASGFSLIENAEGAWGSFYGKRVNPILRKELEKTMQPARESSGFMQGVERVRSLITGGYLAAPNVLTANLAGGIYSSAMAGISPVRYVSALAQTIPELLRGERKDLDRLREFIGVGAGSLLEQDVMKTLKQSARDASGLHKGTAGQTFANVADFVQGQIQKPFGVWWAGLEGFEFLETAMRVSAFKAERQLWGNDLTRLEKYVPGVSRMSAEDAAHAVDKFAAQKARIALLDYSELPEPISKLRNTGLLPFAAFPYLIGSRNLNAAINKPGALAMAQRIPEALWNASFSDDDEQLRVWAGMPEWLKGEHGAPVRMFTDAAGDRRVSVIPMSGLLPTQTWAGSAYGETLSSLGLYGPLWDIFNAFQSGTGEAPIAGRYGKRVYEPDARGVSKLAQAGQFLVGSLAPSYTKKAASLLGAGYNAGVNLTRSGVPMDKELADTLYTFQERETGKAKRRLADELFSTFLRSPQIVTESGPLASVRKEAERLKARRSSELNSIKQRYSKAASAGNTAKAERIKAEYQARAQEFQELEEALAKAYGGSSQ